MTIERSCRLGRHRIHPGLQTVRCERERLELLLVERRRVDAQEPVDGVIGRPDELCDALSDHTFDRIGVKARNQPKRNEKIKNLRRSPR